jgi:hypothetical protein
VPDEESTPLLPHGALAAAPEAINRHPVANSEPTTANGRHTTDQRGTNTTILSAQGDDGRSATTHQSIDTANAGH